LFSALQVKEQLSLNNVVTLKTRPVFSCSRTRIYRLSFMGNQVNY
jgi:hypothetical protein